MRPLIYFQPKSRDTHNYEGMRVVKNLYEAARLMSIDFTTDPLQAYDLAHFVSTKAYKYIKNALLRKVPVIISALMSENDPDARLLLKTGDKWRIKQRDLAILQAATLIIVPTTSGKTILNHLGVTTPIEVLSEGVIKGRFVQGHELEKGIFPRYFGYNPKRQLVIANGRYSKESGLPDYIDIARKFPEVDFYYFGPQPNLLSLWFFKREYRTAPPNVYLKKTIHEDVYRSALMNAIVFMLPSYYPSGTVSVLDPMMSKCQIIARKTAIYPDLIIDKKTGFIGDSNYELEKTLARFLAGHQQATTEQAYQKALELDLEKIAPRLKDIYESLTGLNQQALPMK
jgi:1,2-diacylglycerol-3-alpha-glucose alpha-1,2-glucosyltransferase